MTAKQSVDQVPSDQVRRGSNTGVTTQLNNKAVQVGTDSIDRGVGKVFIRPPLVAKIGLRALLRFDGPAVSVRVPAVARGFLRGKKCRRPRHRSDQCGDAQPYDTRFSISSWLKHRQASPRHPRGQSGRLQAPEPADVKGGVVHLRGGLHLPHKRWANRFENVGFVRAGPVDQEITIRRSSVK